LVYLIVYQKHRIKFRDEEDEDDEREIMGEKGDI